MFGRVALRVEDQHQGGENNQIFDRVGVSEIEPLGPG